VGKQEALHKVIEQQSPHIICLNETKLQGPLFMEGYWAHQTELLYGRILGTPDRATEKWRVLDSSLQRDQLDPYKVTQDLHVLD